jgi:hypothetical protein
MNPEMKQTFVEHKASCLPWCKVLFPHYKSKRRRKIINKKDGEKEGSYISFQVQFFMNLLYFSFLFAFITICVNKILGFFLPLHFIDTYVCVCVCVYDGWMSCI